MHPKRIANPDATCPRAKDKDIRPLVQAAWDAGWWCELKRSNYIQCWPPDGRKPVTVPSTPHKKGRRFDNLRGEFRRAGLNV